MQSIDTVPTNFYNDYNDLIKKFFWQDRRGKIAMNVLMMSKGEGGLGLCDIKSKHLSLLAKWTRDIRTNNIIQNLAVSKLGTVIRSNDFWNANIKFNDFKLISKCDTNSFWSSVMEAWCKCTYHKPETGQEIYNQNLRFNSFIKIGGKPLTNTMGLNKVSDVLHRDGQPKSLNEIPPPSHPNWLELKSIQDAIPKNWYDLLSIDEDPSRYNASETPSCTVLPYTNL